MPEPVSRGLGQSTWKNRFRITGNIAGHGLKDGLNSHLLNEVYQGAFTFAPCLCYRGQEPHFPGPLGEVRRAPGVRL